MAVITAEQAGGAELVAFLDLIAWSEGSDYNVIVTGADGRREIFTDFSEHPFMNRSPKLIRAANPLVAGSKPLYSDAAGRYQFMRRGWIQLALQLKLGDFSPLSQDRAALELMRERGALRLLGQGRVQEAIAACSNIWASMPGNTYAQPGGKKMVDLMGKYSQLRGSVA
ncbi:Muramidase (phage lambda lysozyme) [Bryocella elongata]|uniref:Muramidase (Phage lambda lysozyme) n=1 Tax=Bryocella elongata TaxID=863522 RepID=A0A1H6B5S3_9BACT|nr:glycoside hydrolase family 104 protein [Bryocella elongata]SEG56178.1 Muramidase (phage lambda lysozyme) [Bryocella elongata]